MAATRAQIDRLRKMCGMVDRTDEQLAEAIERYPLGDERGQPAYTFSSSLPPERTENPNWIPTYDMNAAAADVWEEIAATYVGDFDFSTNDQRFDRSQKHAQAQKQVRHYRSKRCPTSMKTLGTSKGDRGQNRNGLDPETPWIGNLPERDEAGDLDIY